MIVLFYEFVAEFGMKTRESMFRDVLTEAVSKSHVGRPKRLYDHPSRARSTCMDHRYAIGRFG